MGPDPKLTAEPVTFDEVCHAKYPRTINERFERTLQNLARLSEHLGDEVRLNVSTDAALFFALSKGECAFTAKALADDGLIDRRPFLSGDLDIVLTPAGWNRVAEIEREAGRAEAVQGFVAMWFGNPQDKLRNRPSHEFCTEAFEQGFKPGIERAKYPARRIDFKEFNDDVVDEIKAEIRRSRFVVADFTGSRGGVYFEAGYAQGLGLPVIFTCHADHFQRLHFDTNHFNHIVWSSPDELADKLEKRIVATIGEGPGFS